MLDKEEYIPVITPEVIKVNEKTYLVKELLSKSALVSTTYQRHGNEWKHLKTTKQFVGKKKFEFDICKPCRPCNYKVTDTNESRYQKWWDLATLSKDLFLVKYPTFNPVQVPIQRYQALFRLQTDSNYSYWLHKNGLV